MILKQESTFHRFYVGGNKWKFSDEIYFKLTKKRVRSSYNPIIFVSIEKISDLIPNKNVYGLFWSTPTFKDVDCNYLLHLNDKDDFDYIISTSSGNTVEGMARTIKKYNSERGKNIRAILLVPELSSYKVSRSAIISNPYVKFIVLKHSTLDSTRIFADKLNNHLAHTSKVVYANADIKTAAYSQIGLILKENNLLNDDICYVQTVSGGVGPAGFIESAYKLKANPEILITQPTGGKSTPLIDALNSHSNGKDPYSIFKNGQYNTSQIEPTLGSTNPLYAIDKFINWKGNGGRILPTRITSEELFQFKDQILNALVKVGVYPSKKIGLKLFDIEKSGFMAFVGAITSATRIQSSNIIINFTGRYPDSHMTNFISATPHLIYDPSNGVQKLIRVLGI